MSEKIMCNHVYIAGKKKGQICNRFCRGGNEKCFQHNGAKKCEHGTEKYKCVKCGGSQTCNHGKLKHKCKDCGGKSLCIHKKLRMECVDCGGSQICIHSKLKYRCKECAGNQICEHNIIKYHCRPCGGSKYCNHDTIKRNCRLCEGKGICEHDTFLAMFTHCDLTGYLRSKVSTRIRDALRGEKNNGTLEYLNCDIEDFKIHIESQFQPGMHWDNHGEWHIDHIIPLKYNNPTIEEVIERLDFTNCQPMWAKDNFAKGNRYIG